LESAEEVRCIEFNPRHGNTVVGGLKNGQISIWDIKGKLETTGLNDLNMSEKEKIHRKHLVKIINILVDYLIRVTYTKFYIYFFFIVGTHEMVVRR